MGTSGGVATLLDKVRAGCMNLDMRSDLSDSTDDGSRPREEGGGGGKTGFRVKLSSHVQPAGSSITLQLMLVYRRAAETKRKRGAEESPTICDSVIVIQQSSPTPLLHCV